MDASSKIQRSIHDVRLTYKYVSRILGTYQGIAVILFGILLSASSAEMNRTVLASWSDFPFTLIGIIVGIVGLVMVFKSNNE